MIDRIAIRNFQKHGKAIIRFAKDITTIIGPSDSGKSAIVRAMQWVCHNRPEGDHFIKEGKDKCAVTLWFGKHKIRRTRGNNTNEYRLNDEDFKSFGRSVPEPVADVISIGEEQFQNQHEPAFWLALSPNELSRRLNEIIGLDRMDRALSKAKKRRDATEAKINFIKEEKGKLENELEKVKPVAALAKEVKRVRTLTTKLGRLQSSAANLERTIMLDEETRRDMERVVGLLEQANRSAALLQSLETVERERIFYANAVLQLSSTFESLGKYRAFLHLSEETLKKIEEDGFKKEELQTVATLIKALKRTTEGVKDIVKNGLEALDKKAEELSKEQCPACGRRFDKEGNGK